MNVSAALRWVLVACVHKHGSDALANGSSIRVEGMARRHHQSNHGFRAAQLIELESHLEDHGPAAAYSNGFVSILGSKEVRRSSRPRNAAGRTDIQDWEIAPGNPSSKRHLRARARGRRSCFWVLRSCEQVTSRTRHFTDLSDCAVKGFPGGSIPLERHFWRFALGARLGGTLPTPDS